MGNGRPPPLAHGRQEVRQGVAGGVQLAFVMRWAVRLRSVPSDQAYAGVEETPAQRQVSLAVAAAC